MGMNENEIEQEIGDCSELINKILHLRNSVIRNKMLHIANEYRQYLSQQIDMKNE